MSIFNTARRHLGRLNAILQRRKQRRQLLQLDNRMLKDLGLSRADAVREGSKRFWQS